MLPATFSEGSSPGHATRSSQEETYIRTEPGSFIPGCVYRSAGCSESPINALPSQSSRAVLEGSILSTTSGTQSSSPQTSHNIYQGYQTPVRLDQYDLASLDLNSSTPPWVSFQARDDQPLQPYWSNISATPGLKPDQSSLFPPFPYFNQALETGHLSQPSTGLPNRFTTTLRPTATPSSLPTHLIAPAFPHTVALSSSEFSYDFRREHTQLAIPPSGCCLRAPDVAHRRFSDLGQNLSPVFMQNQDLDLLQIPGPPPHGLIRRKSAPNSFLNRSDKAIGKNRYNSHRRRSRSRSNHSHQSSCAPSTAEGHLSNEGSTTEANQCLTCWVKLQDERGLKRHQRIHDKDYEASLAYKCDECDAAFQFKKDLDRHTLSHDDSPETRKFKCPHQSCGFAQKGFKRKDHLKRHLTGQHDMDPTEYLDRYD